MTRRDPVCAGPKGQVNGSGRPHSYASDKRGCQGFMLMRHIGQMSFGRGLDVARLNPLICMPLQLPPGGPPLKSPKIAKDGNMRLATGCPTQKTKRQKLLSARRGMLEYGQKWDRDICATHLTHSQTGRPSRTQRNSSVTWSLTSGMPAGIRRLPEKEITNKESASAVAMPKTGAHITCKCTPLRS